MDEILQEYSKFQFQQDNAKDHASVYTKSVLEAAKIRVIKWLVCSPDLNPIETL